MNATEVLSGEFQRVPLHLISLNSYNARNFEGMNRERKRKFEELVESVREQGVIQPITLRPLADGRYEVVAGERRFRASQEAGLDNIPSVVRELDDSAAEQVMATENMLRDDFTPLEEATFFTEQVAKMGHTPDTFKVLAKTYGIDESAIRLRIALLTLPDTIQKAFDEGTITIGHAELFCKISDPDFQTSTFNSCVANRWTIKELNAAIKNANPQMKWAKFPTDTCKGCLSNSSVQRQLFETEEESVCLNPACFREKQFAFFEQNWIASKGQELFGTNSFRFFDDLTPSDIFPILVDEVHSRCGGCPELATAGTLAGGRVKGMEKVCIGKRECYDKCYEAPVEEPAPVTDTAEGEETNQTTADKSAADQTATGQSSTKAPVVDKAAQKKRTAERAKQRGIDQREALFGEKLPEHIGALDATSPPAIRISLIALLLSSRSALEAVGKSDAFKFEGQDQLKFGHDKGAITTFVLSLPKEKILEVLRVASTGTIMGSGGVDSGPEVRSHVAALVGIEIDQHWILHEEYLKGQTKEEIVQLGEEPQMNLWLDEKIKEYKEANFGKKGWMSLKKSDLINCILKSGADLKGKIPLEIATD